MVWRRTSLSISDSCGGLKSVCGGFFKKNNYKDSRNGHFIRVSITKTWPRFKKLKGRLRKAIIVCTKKNFSKTDGSVFFFYKNNCAILKKRLTTYGKYMSGPILYTIKRKRFLSSFSKVI
jgi:ribosomal protein L14